MTELNSLDETIVKDFAERIMRHDIGTNKGKKFGSTHFIQFVRDSYQSEEEVRNYRKIGDKVPEYVEAAVGRLLQDGRLIMHPCIVSWDKRYSFA